MRIRGRHISTKSGNITVTARIEYERPRGLPDTLWFETAAEHGDLLSQTADAWAASLLLCAMHVREPLQIEGVVSKSLIRNLDRVQDAFSRWRPSWYGRIPIIAHSREMKAGRGSGTKVLFPFSGGADSFHCLRTNLQQYAATGRVPPVTHALFVHGFDIPLTDASTFGEARDAYQSLLQSLGVVLIPVRTNLRAFHDQPDWDAAAVTTVIGTGLLFAGGVGHFYYPEINTYDYLPDTAPRPVRQSRFFSNPVVPEFSTDEMRIIDTGGAISKVEKIASIAQWPPVFGTLRVCWERPDGLRNCGTCSKCVLTMTALELEGALHRHDNFSAPLQRARIRASRFASNRSYFPETWIQYARTKGRKDIVFDYQYALLMSRLKQLVRAVTQRFV